MTRPFDDVVICSPLRTPIGNYGGVFRDVTAVELAAGLIRELVTRTGLTSKDVDDVQLGQCYPNGEAPAIGRIAALDAGLEATVPGLQVDRRCGSGLQSVINAVMQVATGGGELILAGGVESMSQAEFYTTGARFGIKGPGTVLHDRLTRGRVMSGGRDHPIPGGMIETAENLRREYGISRIAQDEWAVRSHRNAVAAQDAGMFGSEIVPVTVPGRRGSSVASLDETPRREADLETLGRLHPIMARSDPEATVTAGNASAQNDAAAICVVTTRDKAERLGLAPLGRLVSWAVVGVPPETMGIGPVPAVHQALARADLTLADMDLIEINEAFASQVLACTKGLDLSQQDLSRLNVLGSGISLGHPVGATGTRILATLLYEMQRRQSRYGLETMCLGGGQGLAAIIERV